VGDRLRGRVSIVTGSGRGIGKTIAALFAGEGAIVVGVDRAEDRGRAAIDEIVSAGGRARFARADISVEAEVSAVVGSVLDEHGRVDVLVNNAAIKIPALLTEVSVDAFHEVVNTNLLGCVLCCREVLPSMMDRGAGVIVNMSSVMGLVADPVLPVYEATKAGILAITQNIAVAYGARGIRANAVCPADVDTELNSIYSSPDPAQFRARVERQYPMRRIASPDDVARVVLFLASDDSAFVSGTHVVVDGAILARLYEL
jgi:NAD(P)-dependent dehydrogenase (short-subunit alcohol dehydrogenase family)